MADFNTALVAKRALTASIESIFADGSLTESDRVDALHKNAADYGEYLGLPLGDAQESVAKVAREAGAPSAVIMKVAPAKHPREAAERAAAARRKLQGESDPRADEEPGINPDPALIGHEEETMKHASNAQMLKLAQRGLAEEVAKIRADNPQLSEAQARTRFYAANPGFRETLTKLARGPENGFAKGTSAAQIEAVEKAAEIKKQRPELSDAQAYTKAVLDTPGLMRRLLAEHRGGA